MDTVSGCIVPKNKFTELPVVVSNMYALVTILNTIKLIRCKYYMHLPKVLRKIVAVS